MSQQDNNDCEMSVDDSSDQQQRFNMNYDKKVLNYGFGDTTTSSEGGSRRGGERRKGKQGGNKQGYNNYNGGGGQGKKKKSQETNNGGGGNSQHQKSAGSQNHYNNDWKSQPQARSQNNYGYNSFQSQYERAMNKPKIYTSLTPDGIKKLISQGYQNDDQKKQHQQNYNNVFEKDDQNDYIVLQIIMIRNTEGSKNMKARLLISDGVWASMAIIPQDVHEKMIGKDICQYDIVKIKNSITKPIQEQDQVVIVLKEPPQLVYQGLKQRIGHPKEITKSQADAPTTTPISSSLLKIPMQIIKSNLNVQDYEIIFADGGHIPIAKLNPGMGWNWRVKARVTKKGDKRSWKNEKGEGYLMNVELMDEDGTQIQATLFKDIADKYNEILKEGRVYLMSGGLVKDTQGKFATIKNENCIVFDKFSEIFEIEDDGTVAFDKAKSAFSFVKIQEIGEMNPLDSVDLIGVVHMVGPVGSVSLKNGELKQRRNLLMTDDTNLTICVCFWGDKASCHDFREHPVVIVKNAKVSDFAQKSLNANEDSVVYFNSDLPRARELKKWYEAVERDHIELLPLSTGAGLENMMKEPPKDETIFKYCQPRNNPEENTIEQDGDKDECQQDQDLEMQEGDQTEDTGENDRSISPGEIRKKLFEERRKLFARRWFTKYNQFQKLREQKEISKRGRASSGIGEERIMQMELARSMATRARKRGRKPRMQESPLGLAQEFKFSFQHKKRGRRGGKRDYNKGGEGDDDDDDCGDNGGGGSGYVGGSSIPGIQM